MSDAQPRPPLPTYPAPRSRRDKFLWAWRWFWRVTLVVSLGVAWYAFYVPSNDISWATDYASAQQQAARSGKPVVLFFTSKWCVPCRIMKRSVWADGQVGAAVNAGFTPVMIDRDDPDAVAVVSRYDVGATPTTIVTDPQGEVLERVEGGIGKAAFLELLGRSSRPARLAP